MSTVRSPEDRADSDIIDAELHADSRLRYIQRRMQEDEKIRLTIDNIAYVLRLNGDYEREHGIG